MAKSLFSPGLTEPNAPGEGRVSVPLRALGKWALLPQYRYPASDRLVLGEEKLGKGALE